MARLLEMVAAVAALSALLLVAHCHALDQDEALSRLLDAPTTCMQAAAQSRCNDFANAVAFLCQTSCQEPGFTNSCEDQNEAVAEVWAAGVSELGPQQDMNCQRTRRALHCATEPFLSLCPQTCQQCVDNLKLEEVGDDIMMELRLQYRYQEEIIAQEIRRTEYGCALKRRDSGYDCDVRDELCPEF